MQKLFVDTSKIRAAKGLGGAMSGLAPRNGCGGMEGRARKVERGPKKTCEKAGQKVACIGKLEYGTEKGTIFFPVEEEPILGFERRSAMRVSV